MGRACKLAPPPQLAMHSNRLCIAGCRGCQPLKNTWDVGRCSLGPILTILTFVAFIANRSIKGVLLSWRKGAEQRGIGIQRYFGFLWHHPPVIPAKFEIESTILYFKYIYVCIHICQIGLAKATNWKYDISWHPWGSWNVSSALTHCTALTLEVQ